MNLEKEFYDMADENQLKFFPDKFLRGLVDQIDHSVFIESETNKFALKDVDPKKIMATSQVFKPFKEWKEEKRKQGKIHLDDGSLRHGSDGQRSGAVFEKVLEPDNQGLLFGQSQSGQRMEKYLWKNRRI